MTPETRDLLRKAKARIAGGWCQGEIGDIYGAGPVCAFGALVAVGGHRNHRSGVLRLALHLLEDEAGLPRTGELEVVAIGPWNDAPERTQAEVVALFDRVLLKHSEREAVAV